MFTAPLLLVLAGSPFTGAQQGAAPQSHIDVSATATMRVNADRATIHFLVEGTGETSELALQRLAQKVQAVRDALQTGRVAATALTTFSNGITAMPSSSNAYPANQPPFTARSIVRVDVEHIDDLQTLISTALTAGSTASSAPQFEFSGADTLRGTLLPDAMRRARRDAESIARGLNGTLGDLMQVSTYGGGSAGPYAQNIYFNRYDNGTGQPAIPEVNVSVTVSVQFRVIPR